MDPDLLSEGPLIPSDPLRFGKLVIINLVLQHDTKNLQSVLFIANGSVYLFVLEADILDVLNGCHLPWGERKGL